MLEFICGLLSICVTERVGPLPSMHAVAYSRTPRSFRVRIINEKKNKNSLPWGGHFSAKNFQTDDAKNRLRSIKSTLRKAVSSLPKIHTSHLDNLEVYNKDHVSRGMANSHKMLINVGTIETSQELAAIFVHEMGHVVDLGYLKGSKRTGKSNFLDGEIPIYNDDRSLGFYKISWENTTKRKTNSMSSDFVSGYSMSDPFEDFAEHYIFYRLHGEKFRNMMQKSDKLKQKYVFLQYNIFEGKEFQKRKPLVLALDTSIWDTTLLDYDMRKDLILGN